MNKTALATLIIPRKIQCNNQPPNKNNISTFYSYISRIFNTTVNGIGSFFTAKNEVISKEGSCCKLEQAITTALNSQDFITKEGIFRLQANTTKEKILLHMLKNGQQLNTIFCSGNKINPIGISSLLKKIFHDTVVSSPIDTAKLEKHLDKWHSETATIKASIEDLISIEHPDTSTAEAKKTIDHAYNETINTLRIKQIPPLEEQPLYLQKMMPLFFSVIDNYKTTLMDAHNLAVCFSSHLRTDNLSPQKLAQTIHSDISYLTQLIEREYHNYKSTLN